MQIFCTQIFICCEVLCIYVKNVNKVVLVKWDSFFSFLLKVMVCDNGDVIIKVQVSGTFSHLNQFFLCAFLSSPTLFVLLLVLVVERLH